MGARSTYQLPVRAGLDEAVEDARAPSDTTPRESSRPAIQIVSTDHVATEHSAAGVADLEETLTEDLRRAGFQVGADDSGLTLQLEIVEDDPGSLAIEATVLDASGGVVGHTEGREHEGDGQLGHCAAQISEYVQSLPVAAKGTFPAVP